MNEIMLDASKTQLLRPCTSKTKNQQAMLASSAGLKYLGP